MRTPKTADTRKWMLLCWKEDLIDIGTTCWSIVLRGVARYLGKKVRNVNSRVRSWRISDESEQCNRVISSRTELGCLIAGYDEVRRF